MYQRIMIVVDEGPVARAALDEGLAVAAVHRAEVLFFHVLPSYVMPVADAPSLVLMSPEQHRVAVESVAARLLESAAEAAREKGVESASAIGSDADAAECIAKVAVERACDLLVVGSHGRGMLQRLIFGSLVVRLIPLVAMPMLVCKPPESTAEARQALSADERDTPRRPPETAQGVDLPPPA